MTVAEAILTGTLLTAIVSAVWAVVKWVHPLMVKATQFLEDWRGEDERPGWPRRAGIPERIETLEKSVKDVQHHVKPNGGGSAHDKIVRKLDCISRQMTEMGERMDASEADRKTLHEQIDALACDDRPHGGDNGPSRTTGGTP